MRLLTNAKLVALGERASREGRPLVIRLVELALRQRDWSVEMVAGVYYDVDSDAAEAIVRAIWHAGLDRANVDKLIQRHARRSGAATPERAQCAMIHPSIAKLELDRLAYERAGKPRHEPTAAELDAEIAEVRRRRQAP